MSNQRYENVIPKKVCRSLCLMHVINLIHDANVRSYLLILDAISKSCLAEEHVCSLRVENKTSCMSLCQAHLILNLLSETNYVNMCTSQSDSNFLVLPLRRRYCRSCIKHYCENVCYIFHFKIFDN